MGAQYEDVASIENGKRNVLKVNAFVVSGAALNIAGHGCAHGYPAVLFAQLSDARAPLHLTPTDISWIGSMPVKSLGDVFAL
ncbi:hypothetical protein MSG28_011362 [Choristoneura fumiferana]|uniref:Uncharacterized protein n=1 Tax=Choristoneura fumiferana TaxID=7141 RepID=A0ACC0JNE0_CHOFU|nr:hypothetical protein MSG28_011362 [Choristoneura fumiferana]